jgi:lantibiotic transport system permease protein
MKTLIHAEIYKLKRSSILLTTTILTLLALYQGWDFAKMGLSENEEEIFRGFLYQGSMAVYSWLVLPLICTIVLVMMARMEHSTNSWKQLLAMPVRRGNVYLTKLSVGMGIILYSLILLFLGMVVAAYSLGLESIPLLWLAKRFGILFISALPIMGIIFYLSYRFSHFAVPVFIGAGLAFPSMLVANSEKYWIFYPWDYPIVSSMNYVFDMGSKNVTMMVISLVIFIMGVSIGLLRFHTKDVL